MAGALAWALAAGLSPRGLPAGIVLLGVVLGSVTAVGAMALVLVYRAAGVVNFSQAALGAAAATLAFELSTTVGWSYYPSVAAGVAFAAALGAAVDALVIRRFARAPRFVLTLATIGLAQVLGALDLVMPELFDDQRFALSGGLRPPLSVRFEVGPVLFSGAHVVVLAAVPVTVAALAWFLVRTDAGRAVRAAAENVERARLMGIPVRRLSTLVWAGAGALAGLAAILAMPLQGQVRGVSGDPSVLLPVLAAAVIARMTSLPVAAAAGVGLGVAQQGVFWVTSRGGLIDVGYLVVIIGALLVGRRRASARAESSAAFSWPGVANAAPVPEVLRRLPEARLGRLVLSLAAVAAVVAAPFVAEPRQLNLLGSVTAVYALVAVSLVVLTGWAGQVSLGQFAVAGVGAVVAGNLLVRSGADVFVALLAAAASGAVTTVILGLPAIRARGLFLPVTTLALAVAMGSYFLNPTYFSGLLPDVVNRPVLFGRFDLAQERILFWFCATILGLSVVAALGIRSSRVGRVLLAVRDNPWAAQARGVSVARAQLTAFAVSGALAGLAGGLHVVVLDGVRVGTYSPLLSFEAFSMVVIGGLTSPWGAVAGAITLRWAQYTIEGALQLLVTGGGVLALLLVLPGGLGGLAVRSRQAAFAPVARRRGMTVPGLGHADPAAGAPGRAAPAPGQGVGAPPTPGRPAPERAVLFRCEGLDVAYGTVQILSGVGFEVAEGEVVALLGTNGAGKSTLLRAISGLTPPRRGQVWFAGEDITGEQPEAVARRGIVQMPGGRAVFPQLSVADNLTLAAWTFRRRHGDVERAIDDVLALFPALAGRRRDPAGLLSGGQQQMLALAQALIPAPRLLMVDELSLGLAPAVVAQLLDVIRGLDGPAVVLVEQSVNVALDVADRAVFLKRGQVRFDGPVGRLLGRDDLVRSVFLGEGRPAPSRSGPPPGRAPDQPRLGAARPLVVAQDQVTAPGDELLRASGLQVRFGGVTALDGAALRLRAGEIVGILGPNGAGKTTLFDVLSGFTEPDGGSVVYRGRDLRGVGPDVRALAGLCRSFQDSRLFPGLTVAENLAVACERLVTSFGPLPAALRLPGARASERLVHARVDELLAALGLGDWRDRFPGELSTGLRRLVELGCLLALEPAVLLLDEPSAGLAQSEAEALAPLLREVRDATGCALAVIAHDVPLLLDASDRLVAMELGRVITDGDPAEVVADERVLAAYLGSPG